MATNAMLSGTRYIIFQETAVGTEIDLGKYLFAPTTNRFTLSDSRVDQ